VDEVNNHFYKLMNLTVMKGTPVKIEQQKLENEFISDLFDKDRCNGCSKIVAFILKEEQSDEHSSQF
jgi:hypothetical protein